MSLLLLFKSSSGGGGASVGTAFQSFVEAGMFLGQWQIDDYLTFTACIHDQAGAAADADAVPSYAIYEDETSTAVVSGNMAKLGSVTGFYTERVQLTAANGFDEGKTYAIRIAATVGGVAAAAAHVFQVEAALATAAIVAAIKAKTDLINATGITVVSAVDGEVLTIYQAVTLEGTVSGLTIPATWTAIYLTIKAATKQTDAQATVQILKSNPGAVLTDGLTRLNGAAGTLAQGSLTVDQGAGTVAIWLADNATDDLALAAGLVWSLKALQSDGDSVLLAAGTCNVLGQATATV